jgi:hypothetical protein
MSLQVNGGHTKEACVEKEGQLSWKDGCLSVAQLAMGAT